MCASEINDLVIHPLILSLSLSLFLSLKHTHAHTHTLTTFQSPSGGGVRDINTGGQAKRALWCVKYIQRRRRCCITGRYKYTWYHYLVYNAAHTHTHIYRHAHSHSHT